MIKYFDGYAVFNNRKYRKDLKNGYYLNTTHRKRLHRVVWEHFNGVIPKGYQIHHKDGNKDNNNIENLECLTIKQHMTLHSSERCKNKTWFNKFHESGIEKAKEWHASEQGNNWHKEHYEKMKHKWLDKKKFKCVNCFKEFEAPNNGINRYCSNKCKSAYRRKNGLNNEKRKCLYCNNKFITDKYKKAKCCSVTCSNKYRALK